MGHIHEKIDFTVSVFVVHEDKVLLVHHRKLNKWLPIGGHIELDEDPEMAALRETEEESGLRVTLVGDRPPITGHGTRALIAPRHLDIHRINESHEHIGMIYWARSETSQIRLAAAEHHAIRWVSRGELLNLEPGITPPILWYCTQVLDELGTGASSTIR